MEDEPEIGTFKSLLSINELKVIPRVVWIDEAAFIDSSEGPRALYTKGACPCGILILVSRKGPRWKPYHAALAHVNSATEESIAEMFALLRRGQDVLTDAYIIGGQIYTSNMILKAAKSQPWVHVKFKWPNIGLRRVDAAAVDNEGRVYYGEREDLNLMDIWNGNPGHNNDCTLVFTDLRTNRPQSEENGKFDTLKNRSLQKTKSLEVQYMDHQMERDYQEIFECITGKYVSAARGSLSRFKKNRNPEQRYQYQYMMEYLEATAMFFCTTGTPNGLKQKVIGFAEQEGWTSLLRKMSKSDMMLPEDRRLATQALHRLEINNFGKTKLGRPRNAVRLQKTGTNGI